jgi:hypothetical protein
MTSTLPTVVSSSKDWDDVRTAFASSIMVDTALVSLAQNLDGLDWPISGPGETPAAYIDLKYDEVRRVLTERGQADGVELLSRILRETLAFDEPFGEMVKQTEASARRDNPLLRSLARLKISEEFPLALTSLDDAAAELCQLEHLETIGQFALFAQGLSQSVIIGGDFKKLLNALAHLDEASLAELLPYRVGEKGLHLAEALGQAALTAEPAEQTACAVHWFAHEFDEWRNGSASDRSSISRRLVVLKNPSLIPQIEALLVPHLPTVKSGSWWSRPIRWLGL